MKHLSNWINDLADKFLRSSNNTSKTLEEQIEKLAEQPQDTSTMRLKTLLDDGYIDVVWKTSPGAVDSECLRLNDQKWALNIFLEDTRYEAPIFSKSHPNCTCRVIVTKEGQEPVEIIALG